VPGTRTRSRRVAPAALALTLGLLAAAATRAEGPVRFEPPKFSASGPSAVDVDPGSPVELRVPRSALLRSSAGRNRFLDSYLVPQLSRQLDDVAPAHPAVSRGDDWIDYVLHEDLTASVERGARSGARQALRSFVLETTLLDKMVSSAKGRWSGPRRSRGGVDLDLGISNWLPELELGYRVGVSTMRIRLDAQGSASVAFSHQRFTRTRVLAGYDAANGGYGLSLRFGF
jgi:hypothetical protein